MSADLILLAGAVHTLNPDQPTAEAIGISDGRIVAIGDIATVLAERSRRTQVIDARTATIVPGLVDGHTHPLLGVDTTRGVDLTTARTRAEVAAALAVEANVSPPGGWVRGWGLDPDALDRQPLHRQLLDEAVGGRPALILLFDGHAGLASTAALAAAGISGPVRFAARGEVVCDEFGQPTGHLLEEEAIELVTAVMPTQSWAERRMGLRDVLSRMAAAGLTGGHVMDLDDADVELYRQLDEAGELPLRLRIAPWCRPGDTSERLAELIALQQHHGRVWAVAGVKLFIDGTIDGGTAWLSRPDLNGQSDACYWGDPAAYTRAVHWLAAAGVATATHAIGDAGVRHVLDTIATAPPGPRAPHRVEHIETLPDRQVARFAKVGAIASMQPTHATDYTLADLSDNWSRRLGAERARQGWRCGDILRSGGTVVFGSDWPVAPFDPRGIMAAAQTRRPPAAPDRAPVGLAQRVSATEALRAHTTAPAVAAGDRDGGRLQHGGRADLTVLQGDPLILPPSDLVDVPVLYTVMEGVVRHRHES